MTEFDQALYDAVMADPATDWDCIESYAEGFVDGAKTAARISAERQATPTPSDEELLVIYRNGTDKFYEDGGYQPADLLRDEPADAMRIAGIRAVREALGAWPQIPEGWFLQSVATWSDGDTYRAQLYEQGGSLSVVSGHGPTPQAAIAAAIAQVQGAGE